MTFTTPKLAQHLNRRQVLRGAGTAVLSVSAIAALSNLPATALAHEGEPNEDTAQDIAILNVALTLEHEAIAAYQLGAESGLLEEAVLKTAVLFQDHHKEHRDALVSTINTLGGRATQAYELNDYAAAMGAEQLATARDVLELAAKLEYGAANAYLGALPQFGSSELATVAARLAADETMHWTALSQALGKPLPANALSFGA